MRPPQAGKEKMDIAAIYLTISFHMICILCRHVVDVIAHLVLKNLWPMQFAMSNID